MYSQFHSLCFFVHFSSFGILFRSMVSQSSFEFSHLVWFACFRFCLDSSFFRPDFVLSIIDVFSLTQVRVLFEHKINEIFTYSCILDLKQKLIFFSSLIEYSEFYHCSALSWYTYIRCFFSLGSIKILAHLKESNIQNSKWFEI